MARRKTRGLFGSECGSPARPPVARRKTRGLWGPVGSRRTGYCTVVPQSPGSPEIKGPKQPWASATELVAIRRSTSRPEPLGDQHPGASLRIFGAGEPVRGSRRASPGPSGRLPRRKRRFRFGCCGPKPGNLLDPLRCIASVWKACQIFSGESICISFPPWSLRRHPLEALWFGRAPGPVPPCRFPVGVLLPFSCLGRSAH